jgi:tetratricopeptide (TPR) repeat protein
MWGNAGDRPFYRPKPGAGWRREPLPGWRLKNGRPLFAAKENIVISHLVILIVVVLSLGASPAEAGKRPPALWQLQQAVASNPQDPRAHYSLGLKYESLGQPKKAIREYNAALLLKPDDQKVLYSLGRLMGELGKSDQAIKLIQKALKIDPKFTEARNLLAALHGQQGLALMEQGSFDAAREALEAGIQANPGAAETAALRNNLGCLYVRENRLDQAIGTFQEVLRQNPNVPQARYNLALLYYSQGDYQAASRQMFALKGIDRDMAGELADYRFRIRTSTDWMPPVKTMLTFPGSPLLTHGSIPSDYR